MAISPITVNDMDSINKINQAIEKANVVDGKLDNTASSGHVLGRWSAGNSGSVQQLEVKGGLETTTNALQIADGGVDTVKLGNKVATNGKLADVPTQTFKGRVATGSGSPQDLSVSQMKSALGVTAAEQAISAEALTRASVDASLQGQIGQKASNLALAAEVQERQAAVQAEVATRASEDDRRPVYGQIASPERPGEAIRFFTAALDGEPVAMPPLANNAVVASPFGRVAALNGASFIAPIAAWRIEPGHLYRLRLVIRRAEDTEDPSNDAVRLGIRWMKADKSEAGTTILANVLDLTVADGRVEHVFTLATADASDVDAVPPGGGIYFRPFIRTFGSGVTHVEVIQVVDATDAVAWSPDVDIFRREIAALTAQIQALSERVETLES